MNQKPYRFYRYSREDKYHGYEMDSTSDDPTTSITSVAIEINSQPKQLTRSVRFTNLDLVITIGSIIGLFFGASLLSFVEIIYIWILRRF